MCVGVGVGGSWCGGFGGGCVGSIKVIKGSDILLSDGLVFMQQTPPPKAKGRLCSRANQFPTPTHSSRP